MTEVPEPRAYPPDSAARARQQFLDHGPHPDDPNVCRACGQPWKCDYHLAAEAWLFPARGRNNETGRGSVSMVHRSRPRPIRLATATMTGAEAYPYVGTNPTQRCGADVHPADIYPRKVHP